jgi:uncharacterized protein (TIGR03067 family)
MNATLLLGVAVGLSAPALKDPPKNRTDLVGEWAVESAIASGNRATTGGNLVYTFTKEGKWFIRRGDEELGAGKRGVEFDPKADPPQVTLVSDATRLGSSRRHGIYKIEGDTATLCVAAAGEPRPTMFESTARNRQTIYVLKRKKP